MIIHPSEIEIQGNNCIVKTPFETKGETNVIWYKVPVEFKGYVVIENQDSALVALLVLAMMNGEDIHIRGQISSKLHYAINTYLIRALNLSDEKYKVIKVEADKLNNQPLSTSKVAATGISCGVDSFSTIATHINLDSEYKIEYLTYFKAGSHGVYDGNLSNQFFERGLKNATNFAKENNLPIIQVETNLGELVKINFQKLHSIFQLSCVLMLQKLISIYYYSSAYRFDFFEISNKDTSSWDFLLIQYLQTESLSIYSSMSQLTRFERTELVAKFSPSYNYLDVCTEPINAASINCSKCEKCLRTLVSLEIIGNIENFKNVFDLSTYYRNKDAYIGYLIMNRKFNQINEEIYCKLRQNNFIKTKHYFISFKNKIASSFINLKKKLKYVLEK